MSISLSSRICKGLSKSERSDNRPHLLGSSQKHTVHSPPILQVLPTHLPLSLIASVSLLYKLNSFPLCPKHLSHFHPVLTHSILLSFSRKSPLLVQQVSLLISFPCYLKSIWQLQTSLHFKANLALTAKAACAVLGIMRPFLSGLVAYELFPAL